MSQIHSPERAAFQPALSIPQGTPPRKRASKANSSKVSTTAAYRSASSARY